MELKDMNGLAVEKKTVKPDGKGNVHAVFEVSNPANGVQNLPIFTP